MLHRKLNATVFAMTITLLLSTAAFAEESKPSPAFSCVPLGVAGGLVNGNLSAYLVAASGTHDYVSLDAGTLVTGIRVAVEAGAFKDLDTGTSSALTAAGTILKTHVNAYLISHPHFDHLAGLVIASPDDSGKPIMALSPTIDIIRDHVFNNVIWANFGNEGRTPILEKYHYQRLEPGKAQPIPGTVLTVEAFPLDHSGPAGSTAFLLANRSQYLLYLGDVGPDALSRGELLTAVWKRIAPLIQEGSLRAIFVECSYPDPRDPKILYGHFTPSWLMAELGHLAQIVQPEAPDTALKGLYVIVTHIKPSLDAGRPAHGVVRQQLTESNTLGLDLVFAQQGERMDF